MIVKSTTTRTTIMIMIIVIIIMMMMMIIITIIIMIIMSVFLEHFPYETCSIALNKCKHKNTKHMHIRYRRRNGCGGDKQTRCDKYG